MSSRGRQGGRQGKRERSRSRSRSRDRGGNDRKRDEYASTGIKEYKDEPKELRELFIGNVIYKDATSNMLLKFLNDALKQVGLSTRAEDSIVSCRLNTKFAFVMCSNKETASNVLNLNGIPFHGGELKISRPAKYEEFQSQPTTHTTWKQLISNSKNNLKPAIYLDSNTKKDRELFVGNVTDNMTDTGLTEFLGDTMKRLCLSFSGDENPVVLSSLRGGFAFVEFRTREDAANAMNLNGLPYMGHCLRISRPTKFIGASIPFFTWDDMLEKWNNGELKLMTSGQATKILRLTNIITQFELTTPSAYSSLIRETKTECMQFGRVLSVTAPRSFDDNVPVAGTGMMFIEMGSEMEAKIALCALKGRRFDGRVVDASFYPLEAYVRHDFGLTHIPAPITLNGPTNIDTILS